MVALPGLSDSSALGLPPGRRAPHPQCSASNPQCLPPEEVGESNFILHWFTLGCGFLYLSAHPVHAASSWMWHWVAGCSPDRGLQLSISSKNSLLQTRQTPSSALCPGTLKTKQSQDVQNYLYSLGPVYLNITVWEQEQWCCPPDVPKQSCSVVEALGLSHAP